MPTGKGHLTYKIHLPVDQKNFTNLAMYLYLGDIMYQLCMRVYNLLVHFLPQ